MEKWKQDYISFFTLGGKFKEQTTPHKVSLFIKDLIAKERKRNVLIEILDYVKRHNSKTDMLVNYVIDNVSLCDRLVPSQELLNQLGIEVYEREAMILYILEKHFNPPKETGT